MPVTLTDRISAHHWLRSDDQEHYMKRFLVLAVAIGTTVGCSPGSASGSVNGVPLDVVDAFFFLEKVSGKTLGMAVYLSDQPNLCESIKANRTPRSTTVLAFVLGRRSATDVLAPDVGDYTAASELPLTPGNRATAMFYRGDANCTNTLSPEAARSKSGLIKLTDFRTEADGEAVGSFDVTFGSGDKLTGNFNARHCDASGDGVGQPSCE